MLDPDAIRDAIVRHQKDYISGTTEDRNGLRKLAVKFDALPVYSDMGGCLLLTHDGQVLSHEWETLATKPENDVNWQIIAKVSAAKKYPDLAGLLPERSEHTIDCAVCSGSGTFPPQFAESLRFTCGECHGLGWVDVTPQKSL